MNQGKRRWLGFARRSLLRGLALLWGALLLRRRAPQRRPWIGHWPG